MDTKRRKQTEANPPPTVLQSGDEHHPESAGPAYMKAAVQLLHVMQILMDAFEAPWKHNDCRCSSLKLL